MTFDFDSLDSHGELAAFLDRLEAGDIPTDRHLTRWIETLWTEARRQREHGTPIEGVFYHQKKVMAEEQAQKWAAADSRIGATQVTLEPHNGWVISLYPSADSLREYHEVAEVVVGMRRTKPKGLSKKGPAHPMPEAPTKPSAGRSEGGRPSKGATARVWEIASEIAGQGGDRAAIIAACVAEGINPSTAGTQYSKWKRSQQ